MKKMFVAFVLACLASFTPSVQSAEHAEVEQVLSKALAGLPGKEGLLLTVKYPPGGTDAVHRHDAHGFIYVLEGSIVMQVKGGEKVTLKAGQAFYEGPNDIHVVGRNASETEPAKFVVFLLKNRGAPLLVPAKDQS